MRIAGRTLFARTRRTIAFGACVGACMLLFTACQTSGSVAVPSPTAGIVEPTTAPAEPPLSTTPSAAAVAQPTTPVATAAAASAGEAESAQLPATVTDIDGQSVTITSTERIISLNGDITEIVYALGLGAQVVGVDVSASYPPDVEELPTIGYQRDLNAEGLLSLNPTLVIGDEASGPPEVLEQVRAAGVPVAIGADPPTLDSPVQKVRFVAQALGVSERGEALVAEIEADVAEAQTLREETTSPDPRVLFFYLRGTSTQAVAGANTPADTMITAAGGINAAAELGIVDFESLSPETVIAAQPDVFVVLEKGLESVGGVDGLLAIPGLAETPAGQNRHVVAMDDLYLLGMGPRAGQALTDLVVAFHGEVADQAP